uniref:Uncharacterized protein n=1 Tax=Branchiostoma floridae TaxID=7739 RepID=C3Y9Q1_BRAFL|eukprot:XP_002607297.1 hypothetical protein BRAFLDRAFT_88246 [Branchiostoma floridae]
MARDPFVSPLVTTQGEPPVSLHSRVPLAPREDIIELYTAVAQTGGPNYIGARIPVKTSLNIPVWRALLANYSNTSIPDFLEFGWPINIHPENYNFPHNVHHSNHRSALDYQADVDLFIDKELRYGAMGWCTFWKGRYKNSGVSAGCFSTISTARSVKKYCNRPDPVQQLEC